MSIYLASVMACIIVVIRILHMDTLKSEHGHSGMLSCTLAGVINVLVSSIVLIGNCITGLYRYISAIYQHEYG